METETFQAGIRRLGEVAERSGLAVLMCAEAVWWRCHRALISDYLKVRDVEVARILDRAKTQLDLFTPAATVREGTLSYAGEETPL